MIRKQLEREESRDKPDTHYINLIKQTIADGGMSFKDWVEAGRFMTDTTFREKYRGRRIKKGTTTVVVYLGEFIIQIMGPSKYVVGSQELSSLSEAEKVLWEKKAKHEIRNI